MKIIGITGGIGSGKSIITKILASLNIPTFDSDIIARELMSSNHKVITQIKNQIDPKCYDKNGSIDKKFIRDLIFNDKKNLSIINNIIHPLVRDTLYENFKKCERNNFVIMESAILFESKFDNLCDFIVNVFADEEIRIKRIIKERNLSREVIKKIISVQIGDKTKKLKSNFSIDNNDNKAVIPQVLELISLLKSGD